MTPHIRQGHRRKALALAIATLFAAPALQAQDKALKEVEVVGTSPLPGIGIEKEKLPYDVQTVSDEQLYRGQALNLTEFMSRNLLGVNINEVQGSPFQADITYRGFRLSGILGSSQGMSVYLDGVRVNEPFGDVVNWDMIPEAAIGNVTLVPGSNPVYGLNTLGGALAFTTKSGLTAPGGELKLQAGSFGRVRADVSYGRKGDDGYHSFVAATAFREDGWRDYSSGDLGNVFAKIGRQQNDSNWDLSLLVGRSNLLGNGLLPSNHYGNEENLDDESGGAAGVRGSGIYETNRRGVYTHPDRTRNELNQLTFNFQRLLDSSTELAANAYVRQSKRRTVGGDAEREEVDPPTNPTTYDNESVLNYTSTTSTSFGSSVNLTKLYEQHQFTIGGALDASESKYGGSQTSGCSLDSSRGVGNCVGGTLDEAGVKGKSFALGLYGSDTYRVSDATHLTGALRFNHAKVSNHLTSYYEYDQQDQDLERRQSPVTQREKFSYNSLNPSLGISHKLNEAMTIFGNLGQSNRVPTAIELGCADPANPCRLPTGLQADPYLKQVIARTLETGMRWQLSSDTGMSVAVYRSDNKDDILFRALSASGFGYFSNFSRTRRQGVDMSVFTSVGAISFRASYSYLDATYQAEDKLFGGERDIQVRPGTKIAGLPEHTLRLNADWRTTDKMTLGGSLLATSSLVSQGNEDGRIGIEDDETITASAKVKGYTILNLHANYEAQKGLDYFARINNVFDTRYETYGLMALSMFDTNGLRIQNPGDGPNMSRFVAPGAPRSVMVGVRYRF